MYRIGSDVRYLFGDRLYLMCRDQLVFCFLYLPNTSSFPALYFHLTLPNHSGLRHTVGKSYPTLVVDKSCVMLSCALLSARNGKE